MEKINFRFISDLEGGQQLKAYVPTSRGKVIGNSGPTVATGVDLGQMSSAEVMDLNLPIELRIKLVPYTGITGQDALTFLQKNPLTITQKEADLLDDIKADQIFGELISAYDRESKIPFSKIPKDCQTCIASIAWRRGPAFGKVGAYSEIWDAAIAQDWPGVRYLLNTFSTTNKGIKKRIMREAALLNGVKAEV